MLIIFLAVVGLVVAVLVMSRIKKLKFGNLTLITGGVKTGKTQLSVCLAIKKHKEQLKKWRCQCRKARRKFEPLPPKPLLYSNMPIGRRGDTYAPLTLDLLTGKKRFVPGSVVYYNEASLIAGSKDIRDEDLNDYLLQFFKLCAHFTKGYVLLDTQSPHDCHYTIKRSLSTYFTIYKRLTLPVFSILWIRENMLVDGENTIAIDSQTDIQDSVADGGKPLYFRLILNKWWRYYDQYAYYSLVEHLPMGDDVVECTENKKVSFLVRCRDIKNTLKGGKK